MPLWSERLRPDHALEEFTCGKPILDSWLHNHALAADRAGTGRTYVWVDGRGRVVAFYTLAPHVIRREETPATGAPDAIPAVLLARLALDRSLHGEGHGGTLLADALMVALDAMRRIGGRLIVVDAIDTRAAAFYHHHGFVAVPGNPNRLVLKASVAARSLSVPWR